MWEPLPGNENNRQCEDFVLLNSFPEILKQDVQGLFLCTSSFYEFNWSDISMDYGHKENTM